MCHGLFASNVVFARRDGQFVVGCVGKSGAKNSIGRQQRQSTKKKTIETIKPEEIGLEIENSDRVTLQSQNSPPEKEPGQIFEGVENIPEIVSKLRNEANVI